MTGRRGSMVHTGLFVLLAFGIIYYHLLPVPLLSGQVVQPDLLLAVSAAWAIRNPESLPLLLVAAIFLLADLILGRPVGLWALLSLLTIESLGVQREMLRNQPFLLEWAAFTGFFAAALLLQSLILRLALVDRPPGEVPLQIFAVTVAIYPVIVGFLYFVLRVRSPKPAERSRRLGRVG